MNCEPGIHVHPCSALVRGICRHGFPVTRGCTPAHLAPPTGEDRWYAATPACCDEEIPVNGD